MGSPDIRNTDTEDSEGPALIKLGNGQMVVEPPLRRVAGAVAVDAVVVFAVVAASIELAPFPAGDSNSWVVALVVWMVFPWLYGALCFNGNTLGTVAARTKIVKLHDGCEPGPWRAGWSMFFRTVIVVAAPLWVVGFLISMFMGEVACLDLNLDGIQQHHQSIDPAATRALRRESQDHAR